MVLPDARLPRVRKRLAESVARLNPQDERDALRWIEEVAEFDDPPAR